MQAKNAVRGPWMFCAESRSHPNFLSDIAKQEPTKVFRFAIKYGDQYLSDYCAALTLNFTNMETMRSELRGLDRYFPAYVAWVRCMFSSYLRRLNPLIHHSFASRIPKGVTTQIRLGGLMIIRVPRCPRKVFRRSMPKS